MNPYTFYTAFFLLCCLLCSSCKKVETTKTYTVTDATAQTAIATDEVTINNEFNEAADDALTVICNRKTTLQGADIDTSQITLGVIAIYYDGKEPDGTKTRTGSDSIHLAMVSGKIVPFGAPGAIASMTLGNINSPGYEVQFVTTNTSIRFNGTATLTNVSGGYLQNITPGNSLTVKVRGSLEYTFNDNVANIQYNPVDFNFTRVFTVSGSTIFAAESGDTAINGFTEVSDWGQDALGNNYCASIYSDVVQNITTASLSYNPLSGTKNIENISEPIRCTYGVDSQGNVIENGAPYGFYMSWVDNNASGVKIVPYYY